MRTCGIVAEFNPFHNGHKYLIDKTCENGYERIVTILSGNFVQRGEPAVIETEQRVDAALRAGADLVLQLPVIYALSGAANYASGAIGILDACGAVDSLVFGSECPDIKRLSEAAEILSGGSLDDEIKAELAKGITYPAARENALRKVNPDLADIIKKPNNILAVEYISALKSCNSTIKPEVFTRTVGHDSDEKSGLFASASEIRKMIHNEEDYYNFVPGFYRDYGSLNTVSLDKFEAAVLCKLRNMKAEEIALVSDISEGIENRIFKAAGSASTLDELCFSAKTKRYTLARIRRIVMCALIGITSEDAAAAPPYIRILGMSGKGTGLLAEMKETARLPIISKTADIAACSGTAQRVFSLECAATDIYTACLKTPLSAGVEKNRHPILYK